MGVEDLAPGGSGFRVPRLRSCCPRVSGRLATTMAYTTCRAAETAPAHPFAPPFTYTTHASTPILNTNNNKIKDLTTFPPTLQLRSVSALLAEAMATSSRARPQST